MLFRPNSTSRFDVLCIQKCSSAYLDCHEWSFELMFLSCQLTAVLSFSSDPWHQQGIFSWRTGYFFFFRFRFQRHLRGKNRADQQLLKCSTDPNKHCHVQRHINHISTLFFGLKWVYWVGCMWLAEMRWAVKKVYLKSSLEQYLIWKAHLDHKNQSWSRCAFSCTTTHMHLYHSTTNPSNHLLVQL